MRKPLAVVAFLVIVGASLLLLNCIKRPNERDNMNISLTPKETIKRIDVRLSKHAPLEAAFERRFGKKSPENFSVPSTHFAKLMGHFQGASVIDPNRFPVTPWTVIAILEIEYEDRLVRMEIYVTGKAVGAFEVDEGSTSRKFRGGSDEAFISALIEAYAASIKE